MKIYFAGSIRGGRQDSEIYLQIINYLKNFGDVLTEHIGDSNLTDRGEKIDAKAIHDRDVKWMLEADIIIAEATIPSLGVGYEIGRAVENNKKVLVLFRNENDRKLSGMIKGCQKLTVSEYSNLSEAKKAIEQFLRILGV